MMVIKRIPLNEDIPVNPDKTDTFAYRILDPYPNADGYYEIHKTQRYTLPAGDYDSVLHANGFVYSGQKKGNYDVELYTKVIRAPDMEAIPNTIDDVPIRVRICSGSTEAKEITIEGTNEQIGLVFLIALSLQRGTFFTDMCTLVGKSPQWIQDGRPSRMPATLDQKLESYPDTSTTPPPNLSPKSGPFSDGWR